MYCCVHPDVVQAEENLVALLIAGIKYFECNVDVKLLTEGFEAYNMLILISETKIPSSSLRAVGNSHRP